jgi:hypothetical protein
LRRAAISANPDQGSVKVASMTIDVFEREEPFEIPFRQIIRYCFMRLLKTEILLHKSNILCVGTSGSENTECGNAATDHCLTARRSIEFQ